MTDLTEAVRACVEWLGWDWCDGTQFMPKPRPCATNNDGCRVYTDTLGPDGDHFTARILDKLAPEVAVLQVGYAGVWWLEVRHKSGGVILIEYQEADTRAEAIILATHEYLKARQQ